MRPAIDTDSIASIQFGFAYEVKNNGIVEYEFDHLPIDDSVRAALETMIKTTSGDLNSGSDDSLTAAPFDISEDADDTTIRILQRGSDMAEMAFSIHDENFPARIDTERRPGEKIAFYIVKYQDAYGNRVTAFKRANDLLSLQSSTVLKFWDNEFTVDTDSHYRLVQDFDFVVDENHVHILYPKGFEFIFKLQGIVVSKIPENIQSIQEMGIIDVDGWGTVIGERMRQARILAALTRSSRFLATPLSQIVEDCDQQGVAHEVKDGKLSVAPDQIFSLLDVLDHRRYTYKDGSGLLIRYRANGRTVV